METVTQTIEQKYLGSLKVIVSTLSKDGKVYSCHKDAYFIGDNGASKKLRGKDRAEVIKKLNNSYCDKIELNTETFNL